MYKCISGGRHSSRKDMAECNFSLRLLELVKEGKIKDYLVECAIASSLAGHTREQHFASYLSATVLFHFSFFDNLIQAYKDDLVEQGKPKEEVE